MGNKRHNPRITPLGLVLTLGIIYGDIGTSPLYVLKAIVGSQIITESLVLGALSCIIWTLTLLATVKYVILTLQADNKGEGGIFSLYALIRRRFSWLVFPAIIGGCALLADGIITPPISVSSAIEGLRIIKPDIPTVPIVIAIITMLFLFQQFGTKVIGNSFGPFMLLWFSMLGILGVSQLSLAPYVLKAFNPHYAYNLLVNHPSGFWLLGAVFLCVTGAEAMYSDLGHCGKKNVRITWVFVKTTLILDYLGQGAWLMTQVGKPLLEINPFYAIMPQWFLLAGITIATGATIIASQALISGSFTLISEAMRLNLWPKVDINYPTELKGQLYVPSINRMLLVGCIAVVLIFEESANMEAAYGLSITITMLMTTILLSFYMLSQHTFASIVFFFFLLYISLESSFLIANLSKFMHGGYFTMLIGMSLGAVMIVWWRARKIKSRFVSFIRLNDYFSWFTALSQDKSVPKYATHMVYLTKANRDNEIESPLIYSIFRKQPKRADVYWFIHVDVQDEPYKMAYKVVSLVPGVIYRIDFLLGFRVEQTINLLFKKVLEDLQSNNEVDILSRYESIRQQNIPGDFRFVVLEKTLNYDFEFSFLDTIIMELYYLIKPLSLSEEKAFGLDNSLVNIEKVPLTTSNTTGLKLKRIS